MASGRLEQELEPSRKEAPILSGEDGKIHSYQAALSQDRTLCSETSVLLLPAQNDSTLGADPTTQQRPLLCQWYLM